MLTQLKMMLPPGLKSVINRLRGIPPAVSTDYKPLEDEQTIAGLKDAWQDPLMPAAQRKIVDAQLTEMRAGRPPHLYSVLANAVRATGNENGQIIEVGCASGYYSEALAFLLGHSVSYLGIDYSPPMIAMARQRYPQTPFEVGDATALPLPDKSCDILISGCVLLHVPDYQKAIAESVRVSRRWVIFHRTPIIDAAETRTFEKKAYGIRCLELSFSESQLLAEFTKAGLSVVEEYLTEGTGVSDADHECQKTYLCRRKKPLTE